MATVIQIKRSTATKTNGAIVKRDGAGELYPRASV